MDVNKGKLLHLAVAKGHAIYIAVTALVVVGKILHQQQCLLLPPLHLLFPRQLLKEEDLDFHHVKFP